MKVYKTIEAPLLLSKTMRNQGYRLFFHKGQFVSCLYPSKDEIKELSFLDNELEEALKEAERLVNNAKEVGAFDSDVFIGYVRADIRSNSLSELDILYHPNEIKYLTEFYLNTLDDEDKDESYRTERDEHSVGVYGFWKWLAEEDRRALLIKKA